MFAATLATVEMTNAMADSGADIALVVTPSFYKTKMCSNALLQHYTMVSQIRYFCILLFVVVSFYPYTLSDF